MRSFLDKKVRRNLHAIELRLDMPLCQVLSDGVSLLKRKYFEDMTDCDKVIWNVIAELRDTACYLVLIPGFNQEEICDFINFVCTL